MPASEPLRRRSPRLNASPPRQHTNPNSEPRKASKHHHQTPKLAHLSSTMAVSKPIRRSPRLSNSSPPLSESKTLALVLRDYSPFQGKEEEEDPQPLKVYDPTTYNKPKTQKIHLLSLHSSSSKKAIRRSPRLMAVSYGVVKGQCGSSLLLSLSEKKACEFARECLDDTDLNVKCLRSRKLRSPSQFASDSTAVVYRKRKHDSENNFDDSPVNRDHLRRSSRLSDEKSGRSPAMKGSINKSGGKLALPSSSMINNSRKRRKLDSGRHSELSQNISVNSGQLRRSKGLADENGENFAFNSGKCMNLGSRRHSDHPSETSADKSGEPLQREGPESALLELPCSSIMAENLGFSEKTPLDQDPLRPCQGFSGDKAFQSSVCDELADQMEGTSEIVPLPLMRSIMEEIFGEIEEEKVLRRSPREVSSICLVDDYECTAMKEFEIPSSKKKKKKKEKERPKVNKDEPSPYSANKDHLMNKSSFFVGDAVPEEEAYQRWECRYKPKSRRSKGRSLTAKADEEDEPILNVKCHYSEAQVHGCTFLLGECALVRGEGGQEHIGRIVEFFRTIDEEDYFRVQWFYKADETVMKDTASFHDKKRVFYSTIMDDNLLDCIISKVHVAQVKPKLGSIPQSDFYFDMEYCLDYSTFRTLPRDSVKGSELLSSISCPEPILSISGAGNTLVCEPCNAELNMLDIYAGCGAMSTGLCIGAKLSGVNLVTRWAVDSDSLACDSLKLNHPETQVKNVSAKDFLELLKHWEKLCKKFVTEDMETQFSSAQEVSNAFESNLDARSGCDPDEELEVLSLVDICFDDANESGGFGLKFKVRWKGYDPSEDTWEPIEGLSNCQELIQEFVINGFKNKILPLPGDVDVICGGPPCQGISGYNRFRCVEEPLSDEKNRQLLVFMDIVEYLKPKFVLMENVTDILRFDKGSLGRYALSRLVHMNYQARVGIMAAGCYGLPQFRLRVFFWGSLPTEELPQFPLPTHDVVVRYWPPPEFERNVVAYEEGQPPGLEDAVLLRDAISDLPPVTNYESFDEMSYTKPPETKFQKCIRSLNHEMVGLNKRAEEAVLYDHRPHQLFEDDYIRVCHIPRRKGANFRDLPGLVVGDDNMVRRDPTAKPVLLPSGKPMVPEYAFTFKQGKSKRPFGRLWWDETLPTVVTFPTCHSQVVLHPEQDRVLTVRECARLQGFPDNYRFCGAVKKRYRQVGNAVAIPVAKALGYALGMASQKLIGKEPIMTLPPNFSFSNHC